VLLEHLAAIAREHGIRRFVAVTQADNAPMLHVFADAGFDAHSSLDRGLVDVSFAIEPTPASRSAQDAREQHSEAKSVARLLAPTSVAVIGASRSRGTIGNGLLRNLLESDFQGPVYPVNPMADSVAGVRCYPKVTEVPDPVDLAVPALRPDGEPAAGARPPATIPVEPAPDPALAASRGHPIGAIAAPVRIPSDD